MSPFATLFPRHVVLVAGLRLACWSAGTDTAETVSGVVMSGTTTGTGIADIGTDNNVQI
jgi:hypothetical protein